MAKTKRGGGGGHQQKPAEEGEEQAPAAPYSDDAPAAEGNKDREHEKGNDKEKDQQQKGAKGKIKDGKKPPPPPPPMVTAVLKVDMHCEGCAKRIRGSVHRYPGVEGMAMEVDKGSMTVVGRFDAKKLRDRVADKTRKTVDLVEGGSSNNKGGGGTGAGAGGNQQKGANDGDGKQAGKGGEQEGKDKTDRLDKEGKGNGKDDGSGGGGGGGKGKGGSGKDNKRPVVIMQPVVATVVLKIGSTGLHCDGCMNRIRSKLFKIKGVEQVRMDMGKNQVTVTGTMDAKALPEKLRKMLRRPVDVVAPPGKEKDGKEKDGKDVAIKVLTAQLEAWKAAFYVQQSLINAEFMLSDENPNACAFM